LDLGGYPVILADTAGLRDSSQEIEQEGVRRARARAQSADLRLFVLDGAAESGRMSSADLEAADIVVWNKADIAEGKTAPGLWVSAKTGEGLTELVELLSAKAAARIASGEAPVLTRARHRHALQE